MIEHTTLVLLYSAVGILALAFIGRSIYLLLTPDSEEKKNHIRARSEIEEYSRQVRKTGEDA